MNRLFVADISWKYVFLFTNTLLKGLNIMSQVRQLLHEGKAVSAISDNFRTKLRGDNNIEYQLYLDFTDDKFPQSFDEWINS